MQLLIVDVAHGNPRRQERKVRLQGVMTPLGSVAG